MRILWISILLTPNAPSKVDVPVSKRSNIFLSRKELVNAVVIEDKSLNFWFALSFRGISRLPSAFMTLR